ncbi:hypothetical protein H5410_005125 [Solanum commersonii]|uniref:Non-specific serine/threonine protein kinase n=1 Tax=Solanum commersonii TaxID=4109 RepID=A0A9J6A6J4_SOLCO|nr:hypothetical protein H5410_005125 [Solanum commersonii]
MTNNNFSGPIPSKLVVSKNLTHLRLSNNFFTGKTPSEFGQLEDLRCLDFLFKNLTRDLALSFAGLNTLANFLLISNQFLRKISTWFVEEWKVLVSSIFHSTTSLEQFQQNLETLQNNSNFFSVTTDY